MNKKLLVGATAVVVVAGAVAGAVYYRHVVTEQLDKWLQEEEKALLDDDPDAIPVRVVGPEEYGAGSEFFHNMTDEEAAAFEDTLKKEGSRWTPSG